MDQIYKIGGHCFALPDERLMEAVDGISGFKPFVWNRIWFRQKMYMRVLGCRILLFGRETVGVFRLFRESPMGSDMKM